MSDRLKNQLVRLGSTNPDLRPHLRPILAELGKTASKHEKLLKDLYQTYRDIERNSDDQEWYSMEKWLRKAQSIVEDLQDIEPADTYWDVLVKELREANDDLDRSVDWGTRVDDLLVKAGKLVEQIKRIPTPSVRHDSGPRRGPRYY